MPSRDESTARPQRAQRGTAGAPPQKAQQAPQPTPQSGDDVWDAIEGMEGSADGGGKFNKMNTSFYLYDNSTADIVLIDENPTIFFGHNIKCESDAGKPFFRTEQCQKSVQDYCTMCDSTNSAIGKANRVVAFRLLDGRGSWDSKKKELDGIPAPKIFLTPLYLAKQFKGLKDDAGTISDKVIKLTRNSTYVANLKMRTLRGGGLEYEQVGDEEFDGLDLPEILEVYKPMTDDEIIDFIDKFGASKKAPAPSGTSAPTREIGGFGKRGR